MLCITFDRPRSNNGHRTTFIRKFSTTICLHQNNLTMDPDAIFIILLYLCMLVLTIGSIIGLSRKIWRSKVSIAVKLLVVGVLIGLLIFALSIFDTVGAGNVTISRWEIMIYSASLLIGLNWSINLNRKQFFEKIKISKSLKLRS
jgi:hypothetical protein